MNKKFKLTDKVTKESIRSPEFKRWLKVVLAAVCIFSLLFQLSTCVFQGLKVSAAFPGDTVEIEILPSLPSITIIDMDAVFESNGSTYYGISINSSGITYYLSSDTPISVYSDLNWINQSYRTITIIEMSASALSWVTNNSTVLESNYMTLKAGTYRLNDVLTSYPILQDYNFYVDVIWDGYIVRAYCDGIGSHDSSENEVMYDYIVSSTIPDLGVSLPVNVGFYFVNLNVNQWQWISNYGDGTKTQTLETDQVVSYEFGSWYIANTNYNEVNSPPPPEDVHDFTNEIRQFNNNLTFYNTTSASWYESFSFEFEVIGVGVADTLILERDVNNYYTMSYNYNIDGVTTLQDVYSFHYPTQSGGFIRDNYKLIRFITNPDNTDFQQWLLDNTTLVGTVDDAPTFDSIYETGFNVGYNAGYEQGFANSLIGDSLSGPINALSSITLIQIGDVEITLGGVVMTAIALCLVLAFLKLYAGG